MGRESPEPARPRSGLAAFSPRMSPAQLQSLLQQGIVHHRAGRLGEALAIYTRIRSIAPRNFDALHLAGVVALQQVRTADAIDLLSRALRLNPHSAPCRMRLGLAYMNDGRAKLAEPNLRAAVQLQPDFIEGWDNLAYCLKAQDRLGEALECHRRSTTLNPASANSWYNYGLTLSIHGDVVEALACHDRALAADPHYSKAHFGRAQALQQLNRIPEAIAAYDRYLALAPRNFEAHSYRLFALNNLEDISRERLFEEHAAYGRIFDAVSSQEFPCDPAPDRRLRMAILSPDLRSHSCAYFIEPLLQHLPADQFEIYLYHDHFRTDAITQRLKARATLWRNFVGQPNDQIEPIIRADQPDILIDLAGHTGMISRLPLFARQVAPVQINYLGYPNTTGVPAIRYRFTDAIADPLGDADAFATEQLIRFAPTAWCYRAPDSAPEVAPAPCTVAPDAPITFGCFNNLGKISATTLRLWGRILDAVPASRLILKGRGMSDATERESWRQQFTAAGLDADRVELLDRTDGTAEHLALYHRVDIALDTFPYHGTTTTCEALWMGCPVVSLRGDRHAARVGASLLTAIGREHWVAETADEYVRIALGLASDRIALQQQRGALRDLMRTSPLCDAEAQARRFADALRQCWTAWCTERAPAVAE